jgi:hypothetical protein
MRRFLTLVCLLCLAVPAGISISGCTRNPDANYCNGQGYGLKITDIAVITLQPQTFGISLAYGQTQQITSPLAKTCQGDSTTASSYAWGTTNNQLVDISPTGNMCAGTWNRNTGGGIANYTICSFPDPLPSTGGLPYGIAYVTASASSVTSNPVQVYVHPQVTSVSLVTEPASGTAQQCFSQNTVATLDAQACFVGSNNQQQLLCAPPSVTSANSTCPMPGITPDIIVSGVLTGDDNIISADFVSGGSITGTEGQTCNLSGFNNGVSGATATVALTGTNSIASGTPLVITAGGTGATSAPTTATLSNGTATCSGTATVISAVGSILGTAGQTCNLSNFNNNSSGATATVALTGTNTIASGTPLTITAGGINATAPPTTATLSNGTATCSGTATVATTMTQVPDCSAAIGHLNYSIGNNQIASLNTESTQITAELPGTTAITASIAGGSSSAGYFSTCPPKSISVTLANGETKGTITQGVTQNLTTTILDTNGNTITGLALDYQSTDPIDISTANGGGVTTSFPGVASVYAICQPSTCNPVPINLFGLYGTGLSISSNPVNITVPGTASDYLWFSSPGQSQYVIPVELLSGSVGSTVRLPYVPNSVQMDRLGNNLYFGSSHELMVYNTTSNSVTKQDTSAPGVVLAVAPNNALLLINDQLRQVFYVYSPAAGITAAFGGLGNAASWTPDAKTLYVTDSAALGGNHSDTLYVYNVDSGWSSYSLSGGASTGGSLSLAVTIPGVGAYLSGSAGYNTVAHTWCPTGTVTISANGNAMSNIAAFYPQSDSLAVQTDVLAATTDGQHILGAAVTGGGVTMTDIGVAIPTVLTDGINTPVPCPSVTTTAGSPPVTTQTLSALSTNPTLHATLPVTVNSAVADTTVNQVVTAPQSNLAFLTYTNSGTTTGATLPYYVPGGGTVSYLPLTGSAAITAPIAGAFSPDSTYFFVSTSGDNMIHYISVPLVSSDPTSADTQQISPNLPACVPVSDGGNDQGCTYTGTGTIVPATFIAVKPRPTT